MRDNIQDQSRDQALYSRHSLEGTCKRNRDEDTRILGKVHDLDICVLPQKFRGIPDKLKALWGLSSWLSKFFPFGWTRCNMTPRA